MKDANLLAPCGLYCGICNDFAAGECAGCGSDCSCGSCVACWHHEHCAIYQCVAEKGYKTCAECEDLPCTMLIEFACDPFWRSHLPVIENLRRMKKIGYETWLAEQKEYWSNPEKLNRFRYSQSEYAARSFEYKKKGDVFRKGED